MGALVSSLFAFGAHANSLSFRGWESILYYFHDISQVPHTPLDILLAYFLRTPLCQVVIALSWAFPALLSLMSASLTLSINHIAQACLMSSHAEPFYISFAAWFPFNREGIFPRVSLSYTCILALRIGMFHCLELVCLPLWHSSPPSL